MFVLLNFRRLFNSWKFFLTVDGYIMDKHLLLPARYWESQLVAEWTFTSGGVDVHTRLFIVHRCLNLSIHMLNFHSWSQPRNCFNNKIFPIYGNLIYITFNFNFFHERV